MTAEAKIIARGVGQTLRQGAMAVEVLRDVSLTLYPGELTLLSGPSGSGKSTLLSILGCLRAPSVGSLSIAGESVDGYPPHELTRVRRMRIGFVFQNYHLFSTLTAAENLSLVLDVVGWPKAGRMQRVRDALEAVGLGARLDFRPASLSGGEQQRLAIARAIIGGASIVLADEPTSALDGRNGSLVMELLARLARTNGACVLVVTHDQRIQDYADRLVRIEDGAIRSDTRIARRSEQDSRREHAR